MKIFLSLITIFMSATSAQATTYTPTGTHNFSGVVAFQKDMGVYTCTMSLDVNTSTSSATVTGWMYGHGSCFSIFDGVGTVAFDGTHLIIDGLTMQFGASSGVCNGTVKLLWGGNAATPRTINLDSPLSDSTATSGAPCKFKGTLTQTSGPGALTITNP